MLLRAAAFRARRIHAWWSLFPRIYWHLSFKGNPFQILQVWVWPALKLTCLRKCLWPRWPAPYRITTSHLPLTIWCPAKGWLKNWCDCWKWMTLSTGWKVLCKQIPLSLLSVKLKGGWLSGQLRNFEYHCHGCVVFCFARKIFFHFHLPVCVHSFSQCVHL